MDGMTEARNLLAELETFHANEAGDRAIRILRKIVQERAAISWTALIERTGGNSGPVVTHEFPSHLREPSSELTKSTRVLDLVREELAALIPDPSSPKLSDWPVTNPADAECLQAAYGLLSIAHRAS